MDVSTGKDEQEPQEATGQLEPPAEGEVLFEGLGTAFPLEGEVHEIQLIEEVYEHLGDRDAFEVATTEVNGVKTLHVLGEADIDGVKGVVQAHSPDPDYGLSEDDKHLRQLRERLKSGEDLSPSDMNTLLRAVL